MAPASLLMVIGVALGILLVALLAVVPAVLDLQQR